MAVRGHRGGTFAVFGTGGPSADSQHVAIEFVQPVIVGEGETARSLGLLDPGVVT